MTDRTDFITDAAWSDLVTVWFVLVDEELFSGFNVNSAHSAGMGLRLSSIRTPDR